MSRSIVANKDRWDDWANDLTGHGTTRDKTLFTYFQRESFLSDDDCDSIFNDGGIARKVCEAYPSQYFKKDFKVKISIKDKYDPVLSAEIKKEMTDLGVQSKFTDGFIYANVFGADSLFIVTNDDEDLGEPLDINNVREVRTLNPINKPELWPISYYEEKSEDKYGRIESFSVQNSTPGSSIGVDEVVHESRFIHFDGLRVSNRTRAALKGWNLSLISHLHTVLKSYGLNFRSLDNLITDANVGVLKFKGYYDMIANSDFGAIQSRLQTMDIQKSVVRSIVVDAEHEDYQRNQFNWSGLDKPFELVMLNLSAQTGIPVAILMGREPAGQNATGEKDFKKFYDDAESDQKNKVTPKLEQLSNLLCVTRGYKIEDVDTDIKYESLNVLSPDKEAVARKANAESDQIYFNMGILTEEDIVNARFGEDGYNFDIRVNLEDKNRIKKAEKGVEAIEKEKEKKASEIS